MFDVHGALLRLTVAVDELLAAFTALKDVVGSEAGKEIADLENVVNHTHSAAGRLRARLAVGVVPDGQLAIGEEA
jgi:hypothetical protein